MTAIDIEPVRKVFTSLKEKLPHPLGVTVVKSPVVQIPSIFRSVVVVGASGQLGGLFTTCLDGHILIERVGRNADGDIKFNTQPDLIILATPNPTEKALRDIKEYAEADEVKRTITLVLPQNGIDVVPRAERVLENIRSQFSIVRASVYTNISRDEDDEKRKIVYNPRKNRVALAPVYRKGDTGSEDNEYTLGVKDLLEKAGFDIEISDDYVSMEWTKFVASRWTADTAVTLLDPKTTLRDRRLFASNHRALRKGLAIMGADRIPFADIKWVKSLRHLASLPGWISWIAPLRWYVAHETAAARNNQPSAAAREIKRGTKKVEATVYYHQAMIDKAEEKGMESPYDSAIADILRRNERNDFSINSLSAEERKNLFLEVFDLESRPVCIPSSRFVRLVTEGWFNIMSSWFGKRFEVSGLENLQAAAEDLKENESMLVAPNHRAHPDHIAQALGIKKALGERFSLIIVAGMLFEKEWLSRTLGRAYDRLLVWTVKDDNDENERFLSNIVNRRADKKRDELFKIARIWITYLEGGRTKPKKGEKPQLQEPIKGGSLWLKNPHFGRYVPAVNQGTEKMQKPGSNIPRFASVYIRYGTPRNCAYFREEGAKEPSFTKRDRYISNIAMRDIAAMLPEDERGNY